MVSEHANPLAQLGGVDAGGQNLHVAELSAALVRQGHEVVVHTRRDDPDQPDQVESDSGVVIEHVTAGPPEPVPKDELLPYMGEFGRRLSTSWEKRRPDVVHAHFWMSGLAALAGSRGLSGPPIPVVQTFHALGAVKRRHQGPRDTSPVERIRMETAVARSVAMTIATCADEITELARMRVPRERATVVPCGVDTDRFTPTGPTAPRGERARVVSVGRLVPRKGFATLIAALRGLPAAELVIAGGPPADALDTDPEGTRLRAYAEAAGVADRVTLLGAVDRDQMPALLRSADVVACVPWYEPFGLVPLEAMACGVPVVGSAVGGLLDTIIDGVTGLHVPPRRPEQLAAVLRSLLNDPVRRLGFGIAGADRARSRYGWDRIAADTLRVYRGVYGADPAPDDTLLVEGVR